MSIGCSPPCDRKLSFWLPSTSLLSPSWPITWYLHSPLPHYMFLLNNVSLKIAYVVVKVDVPSSPRWILLIINLNSVAPTFCKGAIVMEILIIQWFLGLVLMRTGMVQLSSGWCFDQQIDSRILRKIKLFILQCTLPVRCENQEKLKMFIYFFNSWQISPLKYG